MPAVEGEGAAEERGGAAIFATPQKSNQVRHPKSQTQPEGVGGNLGAERGDLLLEIAHLGCLLSVRVECLDALDACVTVWVQVGPQNHGLQGYLAHKKKPDPLGPL